MIRRSHVHRLPGGAGPGGVSVTDRDSHMMPAAAMIFPGGSARGLTHGFSYSIVQAFYRVSND
jgi:hypothetical protein